MGNGGTDFGHIIGLVRALEPEAQDHAAPLDMERELLNLLVEYESSRDGWPGYSAIRWDLSGRSPGSSSWKTHSQQWAFHPSSELT